MMTDIERLAAATALRNMFDGRHFSICTIDQIAKLAGIKPQPQAYQTLTVLHCVDWNKMPPELLNQIPDLIATALDGLQIDHQAVNRLLYRLQPPPAPPVQEPPRRRLGWLG